MVGTSHRKSTYIGRTWDSSLLFLFPQTASSLFHISSYLRLLMLVPPRPLSVPLGTGTLDATTKLPTRKGQTMGTAFKVGHVDKTTLKGHARNKENMWPKHAATRHRRTPCHVRLHWVYLLNSPRQPVGGVWMCHVARPPHAAMPMVGSNTATCSHDPSRGLGPLTGGPWTPKGLFHPMIPSALEAPLWPQPLGRPSDPASTNHQARPRATAYRLW